MEAERDTVLRERKAFLGNVSDERTFCFARPSEGPLALVIRQSTTGMFLPAISKKGRSPTGGMIWDSAEALTSWLCAQPSLPNHIIEPGAGLGLVSIALARLGATTVVATDADAHARELCAENAELNLVGNRVTAEHLEWGAFGDEHERYCAAFDPSQAQIRWASVF